MVKRIIAYVIYLLRLSLASPHPSPKIYSYEVVAGFPHDHAAFTQGLEHDQVCNDTAQECLDVFWESTGLYGRSSVRQVAVSNGEVLMKTEMDSKHFGEGLTRINKTLFQIVWRSGAGFMYSTGTLAQEGMFKTELSDGWGLTNDGQFLIATDSSHTISWIDPSTFKTVKTVVAKDGDHKLTWLNELEYIDGELWANVWQTECIARINVTTGHVTHWIMMHGLRDLLLQRPTTQKGTLDVLNGIAWDKAGKRLFVTGKHWPAVFQVLPAEYPAAKQAPTLALVRQKCWPR